MKPLTANDIVEALADGQFSSLPVEKLRMGVDIMALDEIGLRLR